MVAAELPLIQEMLAAEDMGADRILTISHKKRIAIQLKQMLSASAPLYMSRVGTVMHRKIKNDHLLIEDVTISARRQPGLSLSPA